jgi:hypothetical protein
MMFGWAKKTAESDSFQPCCTDLKEALDVPATSLFRVEDTNGILYMAVGYQQIEGGKLGWFESAVLFCPFCGKALQTREHILKASGGQLQ